VRVRNEERECEGVRGDPKSNSSENHGGEMRRKERNVELKDSENVTQLLSQYFLTKTFVKNPFGRLGKILSYKRNGNFLYNINVW